jgi:hypothetical protein
VRPTSRLSYPPLVIGSDYSRHPIPGQQALTIHDSHNFEIPEEQTAMYHTIHPSATADAIMSIPPTVDLYTAVNDLAGGRQAGAWLSRGLRERGVVYVACSSTSKTRRRGFVVRRHNAS